MHPKFAIEQNPRKNLAQERGLWLPPVVEQEMMVSPHCTPPDSEELEDQDQVLVDILTPSLVLPSNLARKELLRECVDRLQLSSSGSLKLYYLIDTETREQQNYRMAVAVSDSKFSLPYVEGLATDNDLLRDRLGSASEAFSVTYETLQRSKAELAQEKQRRKAAEARVKELEEMLQLVHENKRGTV